MKERLRQLRNLLLQDAEAALDIQTMVGNPSVLLEDGFIGVVGEGGLRVEGALNLQNKNY